MKAFYVGLALAAITLSGCDAFWQFMGTRTDSEDAQLAISLDQQDKYCRSLSFEEYVKHCRDGRHQDDHDRDKER